LVPPEPEDQESEDPLVNTAGSDESAELNEDSPL